MLWKLLVETKASEAPTHFAVIFDASEKTFRNEIYQAYKAHRPPAPEELVPQFPLIRDAVRAFNVACLEQNGYEADDLIATYAKHVVDAGGSVTIVSSDKDLMQLVRPASSCSTAMKNKKIGPDEVFEKFGVKPDKVVDVQSLAGDSTDNVPGVPGIGVKTAAELITEYGDLDSLLAAAGSIKQPKRREKLIEFAEQARISRDLVRLKEDVPVEIEDGSARRARSQARCAPRLPAPHGIHDAYQTHFGKARRGCDVSPGMGVLPPRALAVPLLRAPLKGGDGHAAIDSRPRLRPRGPGRRQQAARTGPCGAGSLQVEESAVRSLGLRDGHHAAAPAMVDLGGARSRALRVRSRNHRAQPHGDAISWASRSRSSPGAACYVPVGHRPPTGGFDFGDSASLPASAPCARRWRCCRPLLEDASVLKIGHNIKFDALVMMRHGVRLAPLDDTMLMSYVLDCGRGGHGMDDLSLRHLGHTCIPFEKVLELAPGKKADKSFAQVPIEKAAEYAAEDADVTLRLWHLLKPRLIAERLSTVYETLERPLVPVIVGMENAGIHVDRSVLSRLSSSFAQTLARLEEEINELVGHKFNLGSPKQLGELLFDRLQLPGGKRTKSGQWETRAGLLDEMAANEELPEDARGLINKMLGMAAALEAAVDLHRRAATYVNAESGRIHTSYALASTTTGRLASYDPNLQNIPIRTKEGRAIRTAFVAEKGTCSSRRTIRKLSCACWPTSLTFRSSGARSPKVSTFTPMTASEMFGVPVLEHAVRRAAAREGDQLRHHLRHLGVRARQPAQHRARGSGRLHQDLLRAVSWHPRLHGRDEEGGACERLRRDDLRAAHSLSGDQHAQSGRARQPRARGDQRADPGQCRRHHPARHDPHAGRARRREAVNRAHAAAGARRACVRSGRARGGHADQGRARRDGRCSRAGRAPQRADPRGREVRRKLGSRALN